MKCDLLKPELRKKLPGRVGIIFHLAGKPHPQVPANQLSEQVEANIVMTSLIADYAVASRASAFLYASSAAVYSGVTRLPSVHGR